MFVWRGLVVAVKQAIMRQCGACVSSTFPLLGIVFWPFHPRQQVTAVMISPTKSSSQLLNPSAPSRSMRSSLYWYTIKASTSSWCFSLSVWYYSCCCMIYCCMGSVAMERRVKLTHRIYLIRGSVGFISDRRRIWWKKRKRYCFMTNMTVEGRLAHWSHSYYSSRYSIVQCAVLVLDFWFSDGWCWSRPNARKSKNQDRNRTDTTDSIGEKTPPHILIRAKRVSNCYIQKKKFVRVFD